MNIESLPCGHAAKDNLFEDASGRWVLLTSAAVPGDPSVPNDPGVSAVVWCAQGDGWQTLTAEQWDMLSAVGA